MALTRKQQIILLIIFLIIGSAIFGTSFLDRSCRYDQCRSSYNLCQESCRQGLSTTSWPTGSGLENLSMDIYTDCTKDCSTQLDTCRKQSIQINPICKYLTYK